MRSASLPIFGRSTARQRLWVLCVLQLSTLLESKVRHPDPWVPKCIGPARSFECG